MKKAALWMTYLYFFICPLEFIFNRYFGSSVKYIAIVAAAFILMYFIGTPKQPMKIGSMQICVVGWAVLEAASFAWTIQTSRTLSILISYIMMAILVFAISIFPFTQEEFEGALASYTIGCVVLSLILIFFGQMDGGHQSSGRLTLQVLGSYQDPNILAATFLSAAFFSLYRTFKKPKGAPILNIFFGAAFLLISVSMFLTASRGALFAYVGALLVYILIKVSKKNRIIILCVVPVVLILAYFILKLILSNATFDRLFDFSDYSGGNGRIRLWSAALREIIAHPLFGRGVVSHMGVFLENFGNEIAMHNTFLAILFEVGIVGLCLFMYPFVRSFFHALKRKNAMICAIITANLITAFFLDVLIVRYLWNAMMIGIISFNLSATSEKAPV